MAHEPEWVKKKKNFHAGDIHPEESLGVKPKDIKIDINERTRRSMRIYNAY